MPHEYTRQRQGRDFVSPRQGGDKPASKDIDEESKKTLAQRLEQFRQEAWKETERNRQEAERSRHDPERDTTPIDGLEPPEKRGLQK